MIPARIDRARYQGLVERALESNSNLLRVWGGGSRGTDLQRPLTSGASWSGRIYLPAPSIRDDPDFVADVKREATYQVRRLAHHQPDVWCNNELEWQWVWPLRGRHGPGGWRSAAPGRELPGLFLSSSCRSSPGVRTARATSPQLALPPGYEFPTATTWAISAPWSIGWRHGLSPVSAMACRFPTRAASRPHGPAHRARLRRPARAAAFICLGASDNSSPTGESGSPQRHARPVAGPPIDTMSLRITSTGPASSRRGPGRAHPQLRRRMFDTARPSFTTTTAGRPPGAGPSSTITCGARRLPPRPPRLPILSPHGGGGQGARVWRNEAGLGRRAALRPLCPRRRLPHRHPPPGSAPANAFHLPPNSTRPSGCGSAARPTAPLPCSAGAAARWPVTPLPALLQRDGLAQGQGSRAPREAVLPLKATPLPGASA